jgi:hypothetical protein
MTKVNVKLKKRRILCFILLSFFLTANATSVKYVHFFDAMDNKLMYLEFEYDGSGNNTARSVYMSDGTFIKRTVFNAASDGKRSLETSLNFNEDTLFSTSLRTDGAKKFIKVKDQFGVDQFGSEISYTESATDNFDFFQNNSQLNKMSYEKDGSGVYRKINVYDNTQKLMYYATLQYDGEPSAVKYQKIPLTSPSVRAMGNNNYEFRFNILKSSTISCELTSLSGRQVGKVFNRTFTPGPGKEIVSIGKSLPTIANGVYLMNFSIDGKSVSRDKILIQGSKGGL